MADLNPKLKAWLKNEVMGWESKHIISRVQTSKILGEYDLDYPEEKKESSYI
ncbi:MAG: hypothetical protein ABIB43_06780 [archaeon]